MACVTRSMPTADELASSTSHSLHVDVVIASSSKKDQGTSQEAESSSVLRLRLGGFLGAVVSAFSKRSAEDERHRRGQQSTVLRCCKLTETRAAMRACMAICRSEASRRTEVSWP